MPLCPNRGLALCLGAEAAVRFFESHRQTGAKTNRRLCCHRSVASIALTGAKRRRLANVRYCPSNGHSCASIKQIKRAYLDDPSGLVIAYLDDPSGLVIARLQQN
jgi:hypothetical protein